MAVEWLREKCLFLPVWPPWRAPRRRLTLARPAIFGLGLGLVLRLGQYGRPSLATAGLLVFIECEHTDTNTKSQMPLITLSHASATDGVG